MTVQKSYCVSATAIDIENRNNGIRNRKLDFTRYALCTVYDSTSGQEYVHQCENADHVWKWIQKLTKERLVLYIKTISFANITARKTEMYVFDVLWRLVRRILKRTTLLLSLTTETGIWLSECNIRQWSLRSVTPTVLCTIRPFTQP